LSKLLLPYLIQLSIQPKSLL